MTLDLSALVDDFATIAAEISLLEEKAAVIKAEIIAAGQREIPGTLHKVIVSEMAGRRTVDWQGIANIYTPDNDTVQAYTKVGKPSVQVRLYGR